MCVLREMDGILRPYSNLYWRVTGIGLLMCHGPGALVHMVHRRMTCLALRTQVCLPEVISPFPRDLHVADRETDLYPPVKAFLEGQGYVVKSEVGAADVVAIRGAEPPVIVELKLGFSLTLVHQCVARLSVSDDVYMAVVRGKGKRFLKAVKDMTRLCRRLGLGLLTVRMSDGLVQVHCDPGPYAPRRNTRRRGQLLREFARRVGDPNDGGQTRAGLITAYRQDALKLAMYLFEAGASKGSDVARETGVTRATTMMRDDHYGWFEKVEKGVYGLTPQGAEAVTQSGAVLGQ